MDFDALLKSLLDTNPGIPPRDALLALEALMVGVSNIRSNILLSNGQTIAPGVTPKDSRNNKSAPLVNVDPRTAIQEDCIFCCFCGEKVKMLGSAHLAKHGLDKQSYLEMFGYPKDTALIANSLARARSEAAVKNKLGKKKSPATDSAASVNNLGESSVKGQLP